MYNESMSIYYNGKKNTNNLELKIWHIFPSTSSRMFARV